MPQNNMVFAINDALRVAMREDQRVVVMGEDVGKVGGVFRVTAGLEDEFGQERVIDTPLSENGIVGSAVGMALYGLRPGQRAEPNPPGEWNRMEVEVKGRSLRVTVNGKETARASLDDPAAVKFLGHPAPAAGRIGLQAWRETVWFRNVEVQELAAR